MTVELALSDQLSLTFNYRYGIIHIVVDPLNCIEQTGKLQSSGYTLAADRSELEERTLLAGIYCISP